MWYTNRKIHKKAAMASAIAMALFFTALQMLGIRNRKKIVQWTIGSHTQNNKNRPIDDLSFFQRDCYLLEIIHIIRPIIHKQMDGYY